MNSKNPNSIYELSRQVEDEQEFEREARNIANAYRKVEQLKTAPLLPKQQPRKPKNPSAYAAKVKETLKEINANKAKEMESIAKYIHERPPTVPVNLFSKLQKAAATKCFSLLEDNNRNLLKVCFRQLIISCQQEEQKESAFIQKFQVYKFFRAWKRTALVDRQERLKREQQQTTIDFKSQQLAKEFRIFYLLKKSFKVWQQEAKREARRRQYENKLISEEIKVQKVEPKPMKNKVAEEQSQLQNKVRGFLDGLKEKMQKDRLKTIKQKTEESRVHQLQGTQCVDEGQGEASCPSAEEQPNELEQISEEVVIQPPLPQPEKKPMTNDDLDKKRKELESKHKSRKEALERLRKDKEEKKKEEEKQRMEIERQIEEEQKRIKQEKYKEYLKNKMEQTEWEKRERELTILADQFNSHRLKKYHAWLPWRSIKSKISQNIAILHQTLILILFRVKGECFMRNITELCEEKVERQMKAMAARYCRGLLRRGLKAIKSNTIIERKQKQVYGIMHKVNTLKVVFTEWKKIRCLLASENYDWEKPRARRAQEFYRLQLEHKTMRALVLHRDESKKEKCIAEQKHKIKNKIKSMLDDNDSFDYNEYL